MRFRNIPPKLLNKWFAEDITKESGAEEPLFTVQYFLKSSEGISSFGFIEYEDPPLMAFTPKIREEGVIEDPIILKIEDKRHPLFHVSEESLKLAMMKTIFEKEVEIR